MFDLIKEEKSIDIYKLSLEFDSILGLSLDKLKEEKTEELHIPKEIIDLANSRLDAKKQRNFALADELRGKINSLDILLQILKKDIILLRIRKIISNFCKQLVSGLNSKNTTMIRCNECNVEILSPGKPVRFVTPL